MLKCWSKKRNSAAASGAAQARGTTAALSRCHDHASSAQITSRSVQAIAAGGITRPSQPAVKENTSCVSFVCKNQSLEAHCWFQK